MGKGLGFNLWLENEDRRGAQKKRENGFSKLLRYSDGGKGNGGGPKRPWDIKQGVRGKSASEMGKNFCGGPTLKEG